MKKGFTLAEVLITLGIIGIVAAMTLPALVAKHRKKVLHTQFLKAYSDLSNASINFKADNGIAVYEFSLNGNSSTETLKKLMTYFKGVKHGGKVYVDSDPNNDGNSTFETALGYTPKNLAGKAQKGQPCDKSIITEEIGGRIFSMDDELTLYDPTPHVGPKICIDTNGKQGPNIYGYDWFVFVFTKDGSVKPYIGTNWQSIGADMTNPETACSYTYGNATYTCAYFALTDTSPDNSKQKYWTDFLK